MNLKQKIMKNRKIIEVLLKKSLVRTPDMNFSKPLLKLNATDVRAKYRLAD